MSDTEELWELAERLEQLDIASPVAFYDVVGDVIQAARRRLAESPPAEGRRRSMTRAQAYLAIADVWDRIEARDTDMSDADEQPEEGAQAGAWLVYNYVPGGCYLMGLFDDELEARRYSDERGWGRVEFWPFGEPLRVMP